MKAFIKKIKRTNKVYLTLFIVSLILYLVFYILFTKSLISLAGIETVIRIIVIILFGIWFVFWLLMGLVNLFLKKYSSFIVMLIFTSLFTFLFGMGSYYIDTVYKELNNFSKDKIAYTTNLIALNDTDFNSDSKIGIISDTSNVESNILAKKLLKKENLDNKLLQYDDFYQMLRDLYSKEIDGCFVSSNYVTLFSGEEEFNNIGKDVKVIYSYTEEMENQDNVSYTNKKLTEPFTILVMGVDSENDGLNANQAFNGDTLMLVTFNPKTLSASMFSLPRDLYVPISCRNGALAKINSSAAYGTSCVINTIKNLVDIDIDYYVKINFKGVVDLVDVLGGITVNVEKPYFTYNNGIDYHGQVCEQNSDRAFGNKVVCIDPGVQKLNGEQALAYSRNRHQYIGSDLDRIRHQQDVVAAVVAEAKNIRSFDEFKGILNAVQKNMDTNMTTEQILSLYTVGKSIIADTLAGNEVNLSMAKTYLETYSLPVYLGNSTTSALGYYKNSLDDIVAMMKVNLGLEENVVNKSFSIDYNEDYTTKYYGKGLTGEKSAETMPSLIGSLEDYARSFAEARGINLDVVYVYPGDQGYNGAYGAGVIADQSIHINSIISSGMSLTVYVNRSSTINDIIENNVDDRDNQDNQSNINNSDNIFNDTGIITDNSTDNEKKENDIVIENED